MIHRLALAVLSLSLIAACGDDDATSASGPNPTGGNGGMGAAGGMGGMGAAGGMGGAMMNAELPPPTGTYAVGTQARRLTDPNRLEEATPDPIDNRSIVMQVWYPADPAADGPLTPWLQQEVGDALLGPPLPSGWSLLVETHTKVDVPMVPGGETFPVIIASHGLTAVRNMYTTLFEELASHGYIVASIEHAHDATLTIFPDDGEQTVLDSAAALAIASLTANSTPAEIQAAEAMLDAHIAVWLDDALFTLDQLTAFQISDPDGVLTGRMDLTQVGMFGHSYGGATSAEACFADARFDACLNMDGGFYGPARLTGGRTLSQPFMTFLTSDHLTFDTSPTELFNNLLGAGYQVTVADITHNGFSDLKVGLEDNVLPSGPVLDQALGTLAGLRAVTIMRDYIRAHFDEHVKGQAQTLLDGPSAAHPEVTLTSK